MKNDKPQTENVRLPSQWRIVWYWWIAALGSSIIPFVLLLLYQRVPWAREMLNTWEDPYVFIPILGAIGYRLRGQALWFLLATLVPYGIIGIWLYVKEGSLSYNQNLRNFLSAHFFSLGVALLLILLPMLSVCWSTALLRNAIPMGNWGEFAGNHGPWYRVYDLRYLLGLAFDMPVLALVSTLMSLMVRLSIKSFLLAGTNIAVFLLLPITHYWLVD